MPSLKDLRNRIASVKATQKITKAMKMVAAAKLRRAQEAAEAARPYSQRMGAVLANIAQAVGSDGDAPALMTGTGKDDVHLLVVCTAERGLCGGFNSQIARFARDHVRKLPRRRQDGQDHHRRQEGLRHPAPRIRVADHRAHRTARSQAASASTTPTRSPRRSSRCSTQGEFDVCTLFYSEFKSVISQIPTALQLIPAAAPAVGGGSCGRRRSTNTSRSRAKSWAISSRATFRCRSSARCSKTWPAKWVPR